MSGAVRPARRAAARVTLAALVALTPAACRRDAEHARRAASLTHGGEPAKGRALIQEYGCGSCHRIPGVPGATGRVGPALDAIGGQSYVAGVVEHTPDNLVRWIENPQAIDPRSAMPNLNVSERDARHIAAYLYAVGH